MKRKVAITAASVLGAASLGTAAAVAQSAPGGAPAAPLAAAAQYYVEPPNMQIAETNAGAVPFLLPVPLNRPNATGKPLTIQAAVCFPKGPSCWTDATPGVDFAVPAVTLTYLPGQQVAYVPVTIAGDTVVEPNEEIDVRFQGSTGPWNSPVQWDNNAEIVIANDD